MPSPIPTVGVGVLSDVVARGRVQHHRSRRSTVLHTKAMGLSREALGTLRRRTGFGTRVGGELGARPVEGDEAAHLGRDRV